MVKTVKMNDGSIFVRQMNMVYDMVMDMEAARKITANVPEKLLQEAQKVTGEGITETLVAGLRLLRRQRVYNEFEQIRGTLDLDIDLDLIRERNRS